MQRVLIYAVLAFAVACGKDVSKKFSEGNNDENGTTGANNGTAGVNNLSSGTVAPNNATTAPNNRTTAPNNRTTAPNNQTTPPSNNMANNGTSNNTNNATITPGPTIAYISGQAREFDSELVLANYAFVHVGGDEEPLLGNLRNFWLDGDADAYEIIVVEWGFHNTNLGDNYPQDSMSVRTAVREWVEAGGILLDLSGGFAFNVFPSFYTIDFVLVQAGTYTAFAQDASMPYGEFAWTKADDERNMAGIELTSIDPADGETLLVDSLVTTCELVDLQCANPTFGHRTAMFISKEVGQGVVYHGNWVPPLDDQVVDTVLSVLPPP